LAFIPSLDGEEYQFWYQKMSLDIAEYRVSEEFYNKGKEKVTRAIATYKEYIEGKDWKTEISEGLDNYFIKGEL
jgi:hypothetical protein